VARLRVQRVVNDLARAPESVELEEEEDRRLCVCTPFVVETTREDLVASFACVSPERLCACLLNALLQARTFTDESGKACLVLRRHDRMLMARTGPTSSNGPKARYSTNYAKTKKKRP